MCQVSVIFSGFLHDFVLAKLDTSSIRVRHYGHGRVKGLTRVVYYVLLTSLLKAFL